MTEPEEESKPDLYSLINAQSEKIGELLDYNQTIIKITRVQATNWRALARAYLECANMASEIADECALMARVSVERSGDIIANEWGIDDIDDDEDDDLDD